MRKPVVKNIRGLSADKLSGRILALIIALSALFFSAFYLVGYDMPYFEDANFNAPLLTDVLLAYIYILCLAAVVVTVAAVARGVRLYGDSGYETNGVPARRIALGTACLLVTCLAVTFAFGSSEPLRVNGADYTETFWLKLTDMFIYTALILGLVAVVAVAYGVSGYNRRINKRGKKG